MKKTQGVQKYIKQKWKTSTPFPRNKLPFAIWYLPFQALAGWWLSL